MSNSHALGIHSVYVWVCCCAALSRRSYVNAASRASRGRTSPCLQAAKRRRGSPPAGSTCQHSRAQDPPPHPPCCRQAAVHQAAVQATSSESLGRTPDRRRPAVCASQVEAPAHGCPVLFGNPHHRLKRRRVAVLSFLAVSHSNSPPLESKVPFCRLCSRSAKRGPSSCGGKHPNYNENLMSQLRAGCWELK